MSKITLDPKELVFRVPISAYMTLMERLYRARVEFDKAATPAQHIAAWTKAIGALRGHLNYYWESRLQDTFWNEIEVAQSNGEIMAAFKATAPIAQMLTELIAALENIATGRASPALGIKGKRAPLGHQGRLGGACAIVDLFVEHQLKSEKKAAQEVVDVACDQGIDLWHKKSASPDYQRLLSFRAQLRLVRPGHKDWEGMAPARNAYDVMHSYWKREAGTKPFTTAEASRAADILLKKLWGELYRRK